LGILQHFRRARSEPVYPDLIDGQRVGRAGRQALDPTTVRIRFPICRSLIRLEDVHLKNRQLLIETFFSLNEMAAPACSDC
jgi:hypothetical protein